MESNHFQILARLIGSLSGKSIIRIKRGQLKYGRTLEQRSMFQSYELAVFCLLVGKQAEQRCAERHIRKRNRIVPNVFSLWIQ